LWTLNKYWERLRWLSVLPPQTFKTGQTVAKANILHQSHPFSQIIEDEFKLNLSIKNLKFKITVGKQFLPLPKTRWKLTSKNFKSEN